MIDAPDDSKPRDLPGSCPTTWVSHHTGVERALVIDGDKLHVVGNTTQQMTAATLERCNGALVRETTYQNPSGITSASAGGAALIGTTLYASGSGLRTGGADPGDGLLLTIDPRTLAASNTDLVVGDGRFQDELGGVVVVGSELWIAGTMKTDSAGPLVWATKANGAKACDFVVAGVGDGRKTATEGGDVFIVGAIGKSPYIARYNTSRCKVSTCADCGGPNQARTFRYQGKEGELRAVVATAQAIYVVGQVRESGIDTSGYIAVLDRKTLLPKQQQVFAETSSVESFNAVAVDGTSIYAVGTRENGSKAWIVRVNRSSLASMWNLTPDDGAYYDVALDGSDGVLLAGGTSITGVVRRCDRAGVCP